jgi:long-chain acyl-CoA synthetase
MYPARTRPTPRASRIDTILADASRGVAERRTTGGAAVNLASVLLAAAGPAPNARALGGPRPATYRELSQVVGKVARVLSAEVDAGDRVAILAENDDAFVVAYLATLSAGGVAVPLNPVAPDAELARELEVVAPVAVLRGPDLESRHVQVPGLAPEIADIRALVATATSHEPLAPVERDHDDLAVLLFTAGTSGAPKAAMLTHGNLAANIAQVQSHPGTRRSSDDVVLGVLPFFHVYGLNVVLGVGLATGACIVPVAHFDPVGTARVVEDEAVTVVPAVPAIYASWLELPADVLPAERFATVRVAVSGAAPLPPETASAFRERFGVAVHDGYGLTETSPVVTTSAVDAAPRAGSIGAPLPGVEVRLVDADGSDVLSGDPGEIWVRGPNVFRGYWRDPEATAAVLSDDGWLRTGDVAVADDDGFLSIVDRVKDVIIVSGFNVFPIEVEDVVRAHPDVADVAVVGVADPRSGERLHAYVVPEPGHTPDVARLQAWCRERLARYKCPVSYEIVDGLPRGLSGKVLRRALRS